jgi:multiple sugar transport system ATP-binding protein
MQHPVIVEPGQVVRFRADGNRVHIFDKTTQRTLRR